MRLTGRFGRFGGAYVPEILMPALEQLEGAFLDSVDDPEFTRELNGLLADYAGRPTPLTRCRNLPGNIYLKREDLLHGGAHKTNQVLAQGLLAKRMGKRRLIAETGAGQHGVATALAGALLGFETRIYMGAQDVERQQLNVFRMELMGAEVIPVTSGSRGLKDAINAALRDWSASFEDTHYLLGTAAGPHPFPLMVREFQRVIGREARAQMIAQVGRLPDAVIACVGGGSNAIGLFSDFLDDEVALIGVEAAGKGLDGAQHGATLLRGRPGILHGAETYVLQDDDGQIAESWSVSAGLDYPAVGPEHAHLKDIGRAQYVGATDVAALDAFKALASSEGILCAFESAHALAHALKLAGEQPDAILLVGLSGRGDKDVSQAQGLLGGVGMSRYAAMFDRLGDEGALGAFVMLGDPDFEGSARLLDVLVEGGADMVEVGIPFSDPVADGPVIQAAASRALDAGVRVADCFALIARFRAAHPDVPLGILTYANLVLAPGREAFFDMAAKAGADSLLVADLPAFEAQPWAQAMRIAGIEPVLIAAGNTPSATLERIAQLGGGYTYCVTRAGITGTHAEPDFAPGLIADLKQAGAPPPVFGFGISTPDHVRKALGAGAAGVICGSAIVACAQAGGDVAALVRSLKDATRNDSASR